MTDEEMNEEVRKHWKEDERNFVDELEDKDETYIEDAIESFEFRLDEVKEEYGNVKYEYDSLDVSDYKRRNEWMVKNKKLANAKSILRKLKALEIIRKKELNVGMLFFFAKWHKGEDNKIIEGYNEKVCERRRINEEEFSLLMEVFNDH